MTVEMARAFTVGGAQPRTFRPNSRRWSRRMREGSRPGREMPISRLLARAVTSGRRSAAPRWPPRAGDESSAVAPPGGRQGDQLTGTGGRRGPSSAVTPAKLLPLLSRVPRLRRARTGGAISAPRGSVGIGACRREARLSPATPREITISRARRTPAMRARPTEVAGVEGRTRAMATCMFSIEQVRGVARRPHQGDRARRRWV
jgi:hypothetical protein